MPRIETNADDHAPDALIANQKIAAVSDHRDRHLFFPAYGKHCGKLLRRRRKENICRASDTEGRMIFHRLILPYPVFCQYLFESGYDFLLQFLSLKFRQRS